MRPGIIVSSLMVAVLLAIPQSADAQLQVEGKPRWGFDGFVRLNQFNLLTVDIANLTDKPWQGTFRLQPQQGLTAGDIPILQPDQFIEAFGRRRLQFLVYVSETSDYRLKWGRRPEETYEIDEPTRAIEPAIVQFIREEAVRAGTKGVPTFNETEFPTSAAGLHGLGTVILDHVPRWSDAQATAFRDWLYAGGKVHVYHQTAGVFPEFTGPLAELNQPSDRIPAGSGLVLKHETTAQQAEEEFPQIRKAQRRYSQWNFSQSIFQILKELTQPEHNWLLIYGMALVYLVLLFPGCWLLGRKRGDYRITYAAIIGIVALFSVGFRTVGARGYGESTSVDAAALVRPTANNRAIVTQWSNLFVTSGGQYDLSNSLEGNIYSTGQVNEPVPGAALNRPYGNVITEIPAFSSRTLVNTGVVNDFRLTPESEPFGAELISSKYTDGALQEFSIKLRGVDPGVQVSVFDGNRFAPMRNNSDGNYEMGSSGSGLAQVVNQQAWQVSRNYQGHTEESSTQLLQKTRPLLIAWDLTVDDDNHREGYSLPEGEVRVYITTAMPANLQTQGLSDQQSGRILISVPFHLE